MNRRNLLWSLIALNVVLLLIVLPARLLGVF